MDLVDAVTEFVSVVVGIVAGAFSGMITWVFGTFIAGGIDAATGFTGFLAIQAFITGAIEAVTANGAVIITTTLAVLGGGSIATGGKGMKVGIAVLTIIVSVPAMIVALEVYKFFHHY